MMAALPPPPDWNKPHPQSGHVPQQPWEMTSHGYVDKNDDYVGAPPPSSAAAEIRARDVWELLQRHVLPPPSCATDLRVDLSFTTS